jgi:plastocyanin
MRGHAIRRWGGPIVVAFATTIAVGSLSGVAEASGGGGCGGPVTDSHGTTVQIRNFCFGPTILRVRPGTKVTFVNRDPFPHTVLGANAAWGGFDAIRKRLGPVSYRFMRSGVYPYVCTYHPGMVGAIVVGDGSGPGNAKVVTTAAGPVTRISTSALASQPAAASSDQAPVASSSWPVALGSAFALVAVAGSFFLWRRRRISTA